MARKIQVSYVGGTIGMVDSPHGLVPGADIAGAIADLVARHDLAIEVDLHIFDRLIDSANATPADWQAMVDDIRAGADDHDGFVVLHGTDTMAYSASALAFALTGLDAPVVLTGAQRSIIEPDSDGPGNILGALQVAAADWRGVGLVFDGLLLAGARATKLSNIADRGFGTPHLAPWAELGEAGWTWRDHTDDGLGWPEPLPYVAQDIAIVTFAPGFNAARMRASLTPPPDALLIRAYGGGVGPSEVAEIGQIVRELVAAQVPVAVASQALQAGIDLPRYAASEFLYRAGAFGVGDMTPEAAYTKLVFLLSQHIEAADIPRLMLTNLAGELSHNA